MGRGSSKGGGAKGGGTTIVNTDNGTIDLTGSPLVYGEDDAAVSGKARENIESWETKRVKNKVEYNYSVDQNGNPIGQEVKGGKTSVRVPISHLQEGAIHTHIHPRDDAATLGGTFSDGDLRNFANHGVKTYRAKAKEGAYSISKAEGFDKEGFKGFVADLFARETASRENTYAGIRQRVKNGDYNSNYKQYSKDMTQTFNGFLVSVHNGLISGQKKYGYTYTLEKGK